MTLVMPLSDEDTDGDEETRETRSFNFFEKMMRLDREVILFAVLLTSYAAVRNMNQTVTINSQPKPFFSKNPWVNDFYHGEIHKAFGFARQEDITFVMYYAPWDSDCQRAKPIFEKVARYYYKQIHFMAINCWEPTSVCKAHFSKIKRYPVFMVYLQRVRGVEYQGLIDFGHMVHFLSSVITPLHRIHNLKTLKVIRSTCDALVVAFTPLDRISEDHYYQAFYRASLKFLEVDPRRDVAFAVITDEDAAKNSLFHLSSDQSSGPAIKLYLWNSTKAFVQNWNPSAIVKWVHESTHKIATWVYPPGVKSNLLGQFINSGPAVILFTPRNMFLNYSLEYNLLKLAALNYYDCHSLLDEGFQGFTISKKLLQFFLSSNDQWESMKTLKNKCSSNSLKREQPVILKSGKWTNCSLKDPNQSDYEDFLSNDSFYTSSRSSRFYDSESDDEFSAESLQRHKLKSDCRKQRFALSYLPDNWLGNEEFHLFQRESGELARYLGCGVNSSLSFLAMDSLHFEHFASNLGINLAGKYSQTAVFIVDSKAESIYYLNSTYLSLDLLDKFIYDFTYNNLTRFLRSSDTSYSRRTNSNDMLVETISSNSFYDRVINNNKTVLVYFYSPFCTYSQAVYYVYISLANTLKSLEEYISFVRIDGENNDLEWSFSIDKYPSIISFPSSDKSSSKLFSRKSKITISNLSKFILFNLSFELRAQAHILLCLRRVFSDFHSIDDCISNFKLSSIYFINHYNTQLRNVLIHHKLQTDEFQNITESGRKFTRRKSHSILNENLHANVNSNLTASINKIKCKLLYFQLINSYLNNINFSKADVDYVSSSVFNFYQIYLEDFNNVIKSTPISCIKLYHALKNLQGSYNIDRKTFANFQKSKIQFRKMLNSVLCYRKLERASKCQNSSSENFTNKVNELNLDEINLEEHSYVVTNDLPFDDKKEEETDSSAQESQKNEEIATNRILNTSPQDSHEKKNSRRHAILDEL